MNARVPRASAFVARIVVAWTLGVLVWSAGTAAAQSVDQPRNFAATVVGNRITFTWQAPISLSQPLIGYRIEAGALPGAIAVALPVGNVSTYSVTAPNGVYFVRLRALLSGGPASVVSNEIQVTAPPLPLAPRGLTATVVRHTLTLRWLPGTGSATATAWVLQAGSAPGLSDLAVVTLPAFPRELVATVPAGTYYVRVLAVNASGASLPSAELEVHTGPGVCTVPYAPTELRARAGEGGVRLSWAVATGPSPLAYQLVAGTTSGRANVGVFTLPVVPNVLGTAAPPNTYFVRLAAVNECGASAFSDEVSFTVLPPSGATLVGTWSGTVSNYSQPFPWPAITSFQLTLNTEPTWTIGPLSGLWIDNRGCRHSLIAGGFDPLPFVSMESLPCNDGDFVLSVQSNTGSVVTGRCNIGPDCTFRMTRR